MYKEIHIPEKDPAYPSLHTGIYDQQIRINLKKLIDHLNETGKICLKPWYWKRFFIIYKPRYEPCWLSAWWETPVFEKKELFQKQIRYLAYSTDRFLEAYKFLYAMEEKNWYYQK